MYKQVYIESCVDDLSTVYDSLFALKLPKRSCTVPPDLPEFEDVGCRGVRLCDGATEVFPAPDSPEFEDVGRRGVGLCDGAAEVFLAVLQVGLLLEDVHVVQLTLIGLV